MKNVMLTAQLQTAGQHDSGLVKQRVSPLFIFRRTVRERNVLSQEVVQLRTVESFKNAILSI